ncbi:MAG: hypothetical protein L3K08_02580 [Thermoplasmata archaeon]|nr:hypothetical protein [Thermoplasmata archaeon]
MFAIHPSNRAATPHRDRRDLADAIRVDPRRPRFPGGITDHRGVLWSVGVVALLVSTAVTALPTTQAKLPGNPWTKIQHVVIVLMENHAYDNYFGTYCPVIGPACPSTAIGIPPGTCVPKATWNTSAGCVRPFNFTAQNLTETDMPHLHWASVLAWDNGKMDGFYRAELNRTEPFGTYNGSLIPTYWDLAEEFGLGDNTFSSTLSYSLPNHWYTVAADEPAILKTLPGDLALTSIQQHHLYLNQANRTQTVEQELDAHPNVSWGYYDFALQSYAQAIGHSATSGFGSAYDNWNPLAAKTQSYNQTSNFGGFYDGVTPPFVGNSSLSFRVPLIVVSPWTRAGSVVSTQYDFESLLHFVEWRWGLGCLKSLDCHATLPKAFFDFQLHRTPIHVPDWANATYPYVPPAPGTPWFVQPPSLSDGWISNESTAD